MPDLVREVVAALDPAQIRRHLGVGGPLEYVAIGGRGHGRKAIVVVLAAGVPVLFLKTASDAAAQDLVRERTVLDDLASTPHLGDSIPRALGLLQRQERHVLVLSALSGDSLLMQLRTTLRPRRAASRGLHAARDWLEAFQASTRLTATRRLQLVDRLAVYRSTGAPFSRDQEATLDRLAAVASRYDGLELQLTAGHGDFWPGNLIVNPAGTGVVDWEHFVPEADPLSDLWFLLISTAHATPGPRWSALDAQTAFARAFLEPGWFSDLVLEVTSRHLQSLHVPLEAAEVLLLEGLLRRADGTPLRSELAPVGPSDGDADAHARALLSSGSRLCRL